jgi:hypothetical protein
MSHYNIPRRPSNTFHLISSECQEVPFMCAQSSFHGNVSEIYQTGKQSMLEKKNPFQLSGRKRAHALSKSAHSIEVRGELQHLTKMEISL